MDFIQTLAIGMGASWVSGINLYASVATLGLLGRFANLDLPGELEVLTSWPVIAVAVVLYLIEFFADKIPIVDSTWDVVHTFIRDRKSTRLNSSHGYISYAVFCLKKKKYRVVVDRRAVC